MNLKKGWFVGLFLALFLGIPSWAASGQLLRLSTKTALDLTVDGESGLERGGFGAVLFSNEGILWTYQSEAGEDTVPFGIDTPIAVGELSGRFVILAVAKLAAEKKLDLDRPIGHYLTELNRTDALSRIGQLSIRTMTIEATGWVDSFPRALTNYQLQKDLLPALASRENRYPPGIRQTHSGAMIDLLALLVERIRHQPWPQALAAEVFSPLAMDHSSFAPGPEIIRDAKFHYRDGVEYDPRIAEGLVLPFTPSASVKTNLSDLAKFGSALLASFQGANHPFKTEVMQDLFTPGIPGQLDRQGFESGMGWNLTEFRMRYAGRVAWAYGTQASHRCMIFLLPDQGLGIALASTLTHPEGMAQIKRIAMDVLQLYLASERSIEKPEFMIPSIIRRIPEDAKPTAGLYASSAGVAMIEVHDDGIAVSVRGGYSEFIWESDGTFVPSAENEFQDAVFRKNGSMTIHWRSGSSMDLLFHPPPIPEFQLKPGVYRLERARSARRVDTVLIDHHSGDWIITADEGRDFLLIPDSPVGMQVLCDPSSILYGCRVSVDTEGTVHVIAP